MTNTISTRGQDPFAIQPARREKVLTCLHEHVIHSTKSID
jgi:hypothetical protein